MGGFSYPPPPPPPAKAAAAPEASTEVAGSRGRGRGTFPNGGRGYGLRGRGRGGSIPDSDRGRSSHQNRNGTAYRNPNHQPLSSRRGAGVSINGHTGSSDIGRGQKRKRDEIAARDQPAPAQKVETAPAVPSFGAPLPAAKAMTPTQSSIRSISTRPLEPQDAAKKKTNQLGLTPYGDDSSESEDEDDEAAMAAAAANPIMISYGGKTLVLNTRESLKSWLDERKKNWPTTARTSARKQEMLKLQQSALRRKLEAAKASKQVNADRDSIGQTSKSAGSKFKPEPKLSKIEKLGAKLAKAEAEAVAKNSKPGTDPVQKPAKSIGRNDHLTSRATSGKPEEERKASDPAISDEDTSDDSTYLTSSSEDSEAESDSPEAPEEQSSKAIPVKGSSEQQLADMKSRPCYDFARTGRCKWGKQCRFKHEVPDRAKQSIEPPKRKSLYQRLVEQEIEAEDRKTLDAIKYLGHHGHLD